MSNDEYYLKKRLDEAEEKLAAVLELAAFFQDDYQAKLPVVAAFRQWRFGHLSDAEFLTRLRKEDDVAPALAYEKVPPMEGLAILSRHRNRRAR